MTMPSTKENLFSKTFATVIDGSEKRNCWLSLELQSSHVIERRSKERFDYPWKGQPR